MKDFKSTSKILSIVVPSFNMENFLERSITSLIPNNRELCERLEIIIVNDGSTDQTSSIAHEFESKMPESVRVIDKCNGHYGSCINEGLKVASGKYFRILDADDWVDNLSLERLLTELGGINTDVVFTRHTIHYEDDNHVDNFNYNGMLYGQYINLDSFIIPKEALRMHCLTYRTDFLRQIKYNQTEGVCYTDNEYVVLPLLFAKSMWGYDMSLYQYCIGRGEQSVSITSMIKNIDHYLTVIQRLAQVKSDNCQRDKEIRVTILFRLLRIVLDVFVRFRKSLTKQELIVKSTITELCIDYETEIRRLEQHRIKRLPLYKIWLHNTKLYNKIIYPIVKA